jgi:flagellar motor switch protein FliG
MGKRGPARDRIPDDEARKVRELIAEARDAKGLKNRDLAEILGWDDRQVTSVLDSTSGRALRAEKALALFRAINKSKARGIPTGRVRAAANTALAFYLQARNVSRTLNLVDVRLHSNAAAPAVLFHPDEVAEVARHLANEIAKAPGIGPKRRDSIAQDLEKALSRTCIDLALSARGMLWARIGGPGKGNEVVAEVLHAFGYQINEKPMKGRSK